MNSPHPDFDSFYDDQVAAFQQNRRRDTLWDRVSQPSIVLSVLILLVTVVYNSYGSSTTPQEAVSLLGTCLWDLLVYIVPERLLNAVDDWVNPSLVPRPMSQAQSTHAAKSETMRRILRLDRSGGVMASVFEVRKRAMSMTGGVLGIKLDVDRPAGLGNRDNSCYQNSILQGLASLKPLPEYLSTYLQTASADEEDRDVAQTLRTLISDLNDLSNNGKTLWTPGLLKNMSTWTQQDAQEYYSKILDDIDKSVAKASKSIQRHPGLEYNNPDKEDAASSHHSDDSGYQSVTESKASETKLPRNPLEGLLAQRVACVQCGHSDGLAMIPFTCLTLSLGLDKAQHDLYERLDAYTKVEAIEQVECANCTLLKAQRLLTKLVEKLKESNMPEAQLAEPLRRLEAVELALEEDQFDEKTITEKCKISSQGKVSVTKTKQIVIARPPQSLAIHVNRSVFDPSTFNMMKNSAPVEFPKTLDLGPWCLGSASDVPYPDDVENLEKGVIEDEEQWISNPRLSMVAGDLRPSRLTGPIYELRAVVTHYGRHENGHYICYRKHPRNKPPPTMVIDEEGEAREPGEVEEASEASKTETSNNEPAVETGSEAPEMDWWRLSDHNVSIVSEETVLSLSPGVFMLFYDCVDPNTVLTTEDEREVTGSVVGNENVDEGVPAHANGHVPELVEATELEPPAAVDSKTPPVVPAAGVVAGESGLVVEHAAKSPSETADPSTASSLASQPTAAAETPSSSSEATAPEEAQGDKASSTTESMAESNED